MSDVVNGVEKLITPLLVEKGFELVDLTYQKGPTGWTLSLFLDKSGGITLDECAEWSETVGQLLEQSDLIPNHYSLEVSSPGLDRPLKKLKDYLKFLGERVSVKLYAPLNGQKNFHGSLKSATENEIVIVTEEKKEVTLPLNQVAKSKLDPVIEI